MQVAGNDLGAALKAALAGGYVAEMSGATFTVSSPIVIDVTSTIQGPTGLDLGGATMLSQITNGAPVIQINAGPGVDLRYLTLSNFTVQGNGREGDGIKITANGNDRWIYNFDIDNVTVRGTGGYGLNVQGSVFEGLISNSSMTGNAKGGAYFGHTPGGGQVSALRWFGGTLTGNGGAGMLLANGARDISIDGLTVANNNGYGISAEYGITSVTDSTFRDNRDIGVWYQNFGYFHNNTFTTSGIQRTGMSAYVTGGTTVTASRSEYTGTGADPTVLANLQGPGSAYLVGDTGKIVTGPALDVSGLGQGNDAQVTVSGSGVSVTKPPDRSLGSLPGASSSGTGAVEAALRGALSGGTVGTLSAANVVVTSPIVVYLTASSSGPIGVDFGGLEIVSRVSGGRPVIQIVAAPGVNVANLSLSNFSLIGSGSEGAGISLIAAGADRSINLQMHDVHVEHVGGVGLEAFGNVSGTVSGSWMHGNRQGGARFTNAGGGTADGLQWIGGGFRKNQVAGLILDSGVTDMTVQGAYFVENANAGIYAASGISRVEQTGFENNVGVGAFVGGTSTFIADTFSTFGPEKAGIAGTLAGGKLSLIATGNEYYGGGSDPTHLLNVQGSGTLSIAGDGKVIVGPGISVTGGGVASSSPSVPPPVVDTSAPTISGIAASGTGITAGTGELTVGKTVTLTVTFSEAVAVAGGSPVLSLNDGGVATYSSGSGGTALAFSHTVQAGQNTADLAVTALDLRGASVKDAAGNAANLSGATNYNPPGTLKVTTSASPSPSTLPVLTARLVSDSGSSASDGITNNAAMTGTADPNATIGFRVDGQPIAATVTANASGAWSFSSSGLADGQHTIVAGTTNAAVTAVSASLGFTLDRTAPAPVIASGTIADGRVTLNGTSGAADAISVYDGAALIGSAAASATGSWSFTGNAAAGVSHSYKATGTDLAGNTGTGTTGYVPVSGQPPVTGPLPPAFTSIAALNGTVTLRGTSGAGDQISMYDGMTWLGFASTGSDGRWSFTTRASTGATHNFGFNATDTTGRERKGTGRGLLGSDGGDIMNGSGGDDVIAGSRGSDVLTGGAGADTFAFTSGLVAGSPDRITDFTSGTDKLAFDRAAFAALQPGDLSPAAFVQAAAALTSEQRIIFNQSTGLVSYDADGSGQTASVAVAQLGSGQLLKAQDIKVY